VASGNSIITPCQFPDSADGLIGHNGDPADLSSRLFLRLLLRSSAGCSHAERSARHVRTRAAGRNYAMGLIGSLLRLLQGRAAGAALRFLFLCFALRHPGRLPLNGRNGGERQFGPALDLPGRAASKRRRFEFVRAPGSGRPLQKAWLHSSRSAHEWASSSTRLLSVASVGLDWPSALNRLFSQARRIKGAASTAPFGQASAGIGNRALQIAPAQMFAASGAVCLRIGKALRKATSRCYEPL